jgi:hypothetical protein
MPAAVGRLVVEESGEIRDKDDERGFRPGRRGSGAGLSVGCRRRGAGEYEESRRGGGVPAGVECADSRSRPHMLGVNCEPRAVKGASSSRARASAAVAGRSDVLCIHSSVGRG